MLREMNLDEMVLMKDDFLQRIQQFYPVIKLLRVSYLYLRIPTIPCEYYLQ